MPNWIEVRSIKYDLETMSAEDLMRLKEDNDDQIVKITGQIDAAKAELRISGTYADPDWYGKVNGAKRHYGRNSQKIQNELGRRKRAGKAAGVKHRSLMYYFFDVAKEELDPSDFEEMLETARKRKAERDEEADHHG